MVSGRDPATVPAEAGRDDGTHGSRSETRAAAFRMAGGRITLMMVSEPPPSGFHGNDGESARGSSEPPHHLQRLRSGRERLRLEPPVFPRRKAKAGRAPRGESQIVPRSEIGKRGERDRVR